MNETENSITVNNNNNLTIYFVHIILCFYIFFLCLRNLWLAQFPVIYFNFAKFLIIMFQCKYLSKYDFEYDFE